MHTLFVVGPQDPAEVIAKAKKEAVEHIFFGANQSFNIDGGTSRSMGWISSRIMPSRAFGLD